MHFRVPEELVVNPWGRSTNAKPPTGADEWPVAFEQRSVTYEASIR
jgi:hypothetical protein